MKRVLVTAGPTHESIDAVRYIANRSSGRMGIAIAEAARDADWEVTLLLGPVSATPPEKLHTERFTSTADLQRLLEVHFPACDVLIMAAAVADYALAKPSSGKLPRDKENLRLELVPTPDLVAACAEKRQQHQQIVGFALEEPARLDQRAAMKLRTKQLDAIVANSLETMGSDLIAAKIFTPDGSVHTPPNHAPIDKRTFAAWLMDWIEGHLFARR